MLASMVQTPIEGVVSGGALERGVEGAALPGSGRDVGADDLVRYSRTASARQSAESAMIRTSLNDGVLMQSILTNYASNA